MKNRRSLRLKNFDYSRAGAYFVTVCTQNRECLFGKVIDRVMELNSAGNIIHSVWEGLPQHFPNVDLDGFIVMPNHMHGIVVLRHTEPDRGSKDDRRDERRDDCRGDCRGEPCVRPNCVPPTRVRPTHPTKGEHKVRPYGTLPGSLGRMVQTFKSLTTHEYINGVQQGDWQAFPGKLWQRNYYERIIRNDEEMYRIRKYINDNPSQWHLDRENPSALNSLSGALTNPKNESEIDAMLREVI